MPSHQQVPATAPPPHNEEQAHAGARTRREGRRGRVGRRSGDICAHWGRTKFRDPDRFRNLPDAVNSPSRGSQDEVLATAPPSTPEGKGGAGAGAGAGATSGRSQTKIRAPQSCRNPDTSTVSDTVPDTESHHSGIPKTMSPAPAPARPPPRAGAGAGGGGGGAGKIWGSSGDPGPAEGARSRFATRSPRCSESVGVRSSATFPDGIHRQGGSTRAARARPVRWRPGAATAVRRRHRRTCRRPLSVSERHRRVPEPPKPPRWGPTSGMRRTRLWRKEAARGKRRR